MIHYVLWQFGHMHTFHFEHNAEGSVFCPRCGDIYKKKERKSMSAPAIAAWLMMRRIIRDEQERLDSLSTTTTTNKVTLPPAEPKQEVSRFAQIAFALIFSALGCLVVALGFALASITVGVVTGITLAGFSLLTSISLGILSLRENV